jgi:hypothetical protein
MISDFAADGSLGGNLRREDFAGGGIESESACAAAAEISSAAHAKGTYISMFF